MRTKIDKLTSKYLQYITDEIKNQNTAGMLIKFNKRKSQFLNSEFEEEKHIKKIKEAIVYFRNRIIRCYEKSENNDTYILENNEGNFLEYLYFYYEYKILLSDKKMFDDMINEAKGHLSDCWCTQVDDIIEAENNGKYYSGEWLKIVRNKYLKSLLETPDLEERYEELKEFTEFYFELGLYIFDVIELSCEIVYNTHRYSYQEIKAKHVRTRLKMFEVEELFNSLNYITLQIRDDFQKNKIELALKEQQYIKSVIEAMFIIFTSKFRIDLMRTEFKKYFERLIKSIEDSIPKDTLKLIKEDSTEIDSKKPQPSNENSDKYSPSQFNEFTYNLFSYILDEYPTTGIVKYINIWYFLRQNIQDKYKKDILFNFTQDKYKIFVKKNFGIEIKKFQKASFKYDDDEVPILQNIVKIYYKNLE